jgi:hypothetical protein
LQGGGAILGQQQAAILLQQFGQHGAVDAVVIDDQDDRQV